MNNNIMDLKFFFESEKDFFTNAFNEAYNIGGEEDTFNTPSEPVEPPETGSDGEQVEEPATEVETSPEPSKEQIKEMYEKYLPLEEKIQEWLDTPVGFLNKELMPSSHLEMALNGSELANFINQIQIAESGADISCTSFFTDSYALSISLVLLFLTK